MKMYRKLNKFEFNFLEDVFRKIPNLKIISIKSMILSHTNFIHTNDSIALAF